MAEVVEGHHPWRGPDVDRVKAISDGVFGVAMTLLTLDIAIPVLADGAASSSSLRSALLAPSFLSHVFAFTLSFVVGAIFWASHQRVFRYVRRYDGRLLALNLAFLFFVALLPISTKLLAAYGASGLAAALYAANCAALAFLGLATWRHATSGRRLVDDDLDPVVQRFVARRWILSGAIFLLSIALAFVAAWLAEASWSLMVLAMPFAGWRGLRRPS